MMKTCEIIFISTIKILYLISDIIILNYYIYWNNGNTYHSTTPNEDRNSTVITHQQHKCLNTRQRCSDNAAIQHSNKARIMQQKVIKSWCTNMGEGETFKDEPPSGISRLTLLTFVIVKSIYTWQENRNKSLSLRRTFGVGIFV